MANDLLRVSRTIHLYFGLLISPALLFFAFTGAMQTFSLHESVPGSSYKPAKWETVLAQIHKKATPEIRQRKPPAEAVSGVAQALASDGRPHGQHGDQTGGGQPGATVGPVPGAQATGVPAAGGVSERMKHLPLKIFFLVVAIGLFTSTLTGVYMAYKYERKAWVVTAWWMAGVILPLVLMRL